LISATFGVPFWKVEEIPIRTYREMLYQASNIGNWRAGGKFEPEGEEDKERSALVDIARLKREGRWPIK
jgi:hypothetical protein